MLLLDFYKKGITKLYFENTLTFGFEQTFTISNWWEEPGFTSTSDTTLKREKMLQLAESIANELDGSFKESKDIWDHMQYETFEKDGSPSFVVTMDPGSIEVKTPPKYIHQLKQMGEILIKCATNVELLPYRNWWYGIQGGTEGGCHVNFGGMDEETNPLLKDPLLVIKYACFVHNRPWLHYPFMGVDVGPHGNAMRMDEKNGFERVIKLVKKLNSDPKKDEYSLEEIYNYFKETNIITEKSSFPSLHKCHSPLNMVEDRAQEALRNGEEFYHVANLRIQILKYLLQTDEIEIPQIFPNLHTTDLTSYYLWGEFQNWTNGFDLNPLDYQCFFDRQFPKLWMGNNAPKRFGLKEGRRPRVITNIQKRGDVITSKTVDTRFKRFELYYYTEDLIDYRFEINAKGIEKQSELMKHNGYLGFGDTGSAYYQYFDICIDKDSPTLEIKFSQGSDVVESAKFNLMNMTWG